MITTPPRPGPSRIPVPPALSMRAAMLGGLALVLFGVIFFRLWYLQILSGSQYVQQANANRLREIPIQAPRGKILDREGKPLVTDAIANAVQVVPTALPHSARARHELFVALGGVLGMRAQRIEALVRKGVGEMRYAPVTIKDDAGPRALTVLSERQPEFPGVQQQPVPIRRYPYGELAAPVLGYVGEVNKKELKLRGFKGVQQGTIVGQAGLEFHFDPYLRGQPGEQRVEVNAAGEAVPASVKPIEPTAGYNLRTTISLPLQIASEKALRKGIESARAAGKPATAGGYVAIDPLNGEVLAIGSYPSFEPAAFTHPMTSPEYEALTSGKHLADLATEGLYPTGSTFKPITAMAALEGGFLSPEEGLGSGQCIDVGGEQFCNAGHADYGAVGLVEALKVSSDTYFFEVGERANRYGNVIQQMAHKLGVGQETGIEVPEIEGLVPTPAWRERIDHLQEACEHDPKQPKGGCHYVSEIRPWSVGDDMHLAVGQGDLQTSPLQMAVAYSTLVNAYLNGGDGWRVRPHLGREIDQPDGALLARLPAAPGRRVQLNPSDLALVFQGIHEAASQPGGTSADVWAGWDQAAHPVYGKTGTAERAGQVEQSWYMCYVADAHRPIVIAVTVEQGGFGAETAAPIARLIAASWFGQAARFVPGSSKTF